MNESLATLKWMGCMEKILKQQNSSGEEGWAFFLSLRIFTSITHDCERTSVYGGQNFHLKIRMIPKNVKFFFILKLRVEYFC